MGLHEEFAQPIYEFRASDDALVWDRGYRLGYFQNQQLHFLRLDTGDSIAVAEINQQPNATWSVSLDGKFLLCSHAIGQQMQTSIWNLQRGEFEFAVTGTAQWNEQGTRLAVFETMDTNIQFSIWDIETRQIVQQLLIPKIRANSRQGSTSTAQRDPMLAVEPDFQRIAWTTGGRELILQDLSNNRRGSTSLEKLKTPNSIRLHWQTDQGLLVACGNEIARWQEVGSSVSGELEIYQSSPSGMVDDQVSPFKIKKIVDWFDGSFILEWYGQLERVPGGRPRRQAYAGLISLQSNPILINRPQPMGNLELSFGHSFDSPDKRYQFKHEKVDELNDHVTIVSRETFEAVLDLGVFPVNNRRQRNPAVDLKWSDDSHYLMLIGNPIVGVHSNGRVFGASSVPIDAGQSTEITTLDFGGWFPVGRN